MEERPVPLIFECAKALSNLCSPAVHLLCLVLGAASVLVSSCDSGSIEDVLNDGTSDSMEITCSFENSEGIGFLREPDGSWRFVSPVFSDDCVNYSAEILFSQPSTVYCVNNDTDVDLVRTSYSVNVCHTCSTSRTLHWYSILPGIDDHNERDAARISVYDLDLTFVLRDSDEKVLPAGCLPVEGACQLACGSPNGVEAYHAVHRLSVEPGEMLHFDAYVPPGVSVDPFLTGLLCSRSECATAFSASTLNPSDPIAVDLQLPRLWKDDAELSTISPERQRAIICENAGFHASEDKTACWDSLDDGGEYSNEELYFLTVHDVVLPEELQNIFFKR